MVLIATLITWKQAGDCDLTARQQLHATELFKTAAAVVLLTDELAGARDLFGSLVDLRLVIGSAADFIEIVGCVVTSGCAVCTLTFCY